MSILRKNEAKKKEKKKNVRPRTIHRFPSTCKKPPSKVQFLTKNHGYSIILLNWQQSERN